MQHVFTKQHVREFGGHMAQAAQNSCDGWADGAVIDLDRQCRLLTLRALGRSVLGIDLDQRSDAIAGPLQVTLSYSADRALRPVRAPRWLPTPARRAPGGPAARCTDWPARSSRNAAGTRTGMHRWCGP